MKKTWTVSLDPSNWAAFTYRRADGDDLRLLGCIRRGLQMGALAVDLRGRYVQVNGDYVTELNQSQIAAAVRRASAAAAPLAAPTGHDHDAPHLRATTKPPAKPPVVVVRRRRVLEIA
jgi:hypothetical protein